MMQQLSGKVVIVSGVGPGLGQQLALSAAAQGASVVLGARTEAFLVEVGDQIRAAGGTAAHRVCDLTVDGDCRQLVQTAVDEFGGLDCLISNAYNAGPMGVTVEDADFDDWQAAFDVTFFGCMRLAKHAIPALRARTGGSIVFINSQIVRRVFAGRAPYATSKAALLVGAQVLAREVGGDGIRVNSVLPGAIFGVPYQAHLARNAAAKGTTVESEYQDRAKLLALGRIPTDEECAAVALFLASDAASGITGQTIDVNGGETFN
jgi:NAD(P)-dependent dehydrogenase (short-subunit alcohol dehydrogenase family)